MKGVLTWGGEHRIQHTGDVLQNGTSEVCVILLTKPMSPK